MNCERLKYYSRIQDSRGSLEGIVNQGQWQEVNIVKTLATQVRGGHFHRRTQEIIFLLSGKALVELAPCNQICHPEKLILLPGEGIKILPNTIHLFTYLEDSTHIQLMDLRFDPQNQDMYTSAHLS